MTATKAVFIACDGCGEQMDDSAVPPYRTVTEANTEARSRGWHVDLGGRHWCPSCRNPVGAKSARTQRRNIAANRAAGLGDYGRGPVKDPLNPGRRPL